MILTKNIILEEIKNGNIIIDNFDEKFLGAASYDLSLGTSLRIFKHRDLPYPVTNEANFEDLTELIEIGEKGYTMKSGELVLGITKEKIALSPNISGWLEGRSRFARIGLLVHISAPFMNPGIDSKQVLEIVNLSKTDLTIFPDTRICQFIFSYCKGEATYQGRFRDQKTA
jgi:dCTP deaminase